MKFKKYVELAEQTPYDGSHIGHKSSLLHIKQVYGNKYKLSPQGEVWRVDAMVGTTWVPVTTPMKKEDAQKFMKWLQDADADRRQMVGTIGGKDKRLNELLEGKGMSDAVKKEFLKDVTKVKASMLGMLKELEREAWWEMKGPEAEKWLTGKAKKRGFSPEASKHLARAVMSMKVGKS